MHYQKIKIPFPRLTDISKAEKRLSIRSLFQKSLNSKTNAEKVEKYLHRCSVNPILKTSSLLQDFFSPQRETDFKSLQRQQHAISTRSSLFPVVHDANNDDDDDDDDDTNGENINESVSSLSLSMGQGSLAEYRSIHENGENLSAHSNQKRSTSVHDVLWHNSISTSNPELSNPTPSLAESKKSNHFQNECFIDRPECPLDNLEMIKVLGRGCMGKVNKVAYFL
jgi:hypothetical protein